MLISILFTTKLFAQLDTLHYLPPLVCSDEFTNSDHGTQYLWLSTNETSTFTVRIRNNDGTYDVIRDISASSPASINMGKIHFSTAGMSNKLSSNSEDVVEGIITHGQLYQELDQEGLILSAPKAFFVSIRHQSDVQGLMLTSKGTVGLGTQFYSGHMYSMNEKGNRCINRNTQFISVMATEDNTFVDFSNPNGLGIREDRRPPDSDPGTTITGVRLNKGQSYAIAIDNADMELSAGVNGADYTDRNHMNGTSISSNKPVSVVTGSWTASGAGRGRDIGVDHLVPADVVGTEYVIVKGQGKTTPPAWNIDDDGRRVDTYSLEKTIVVATEANTKLWFNKSNATGAGDAQINNAGDYYVISLDEYNSEGILNLRSDKKIYVYQSIAGAEARAATGGMVFVPPIKCTSDKTVFISGADKLTTGSLNSALVLITQAGSQVKINGTNVPKSLAKSVTGNNWWEVYKITKLGNALNAESLEYYTPGTNWNFKVESEGALNAALYVETGATGAASFYSGFGDKPQIDGSPIISGNALCAGAMNLNVDVGDFDSYKWYRNGVFLQERYDKIFPVGQPGRYKVTGTTSCNGGITETFPSNEITVNPCLEIKDVTVAENTNKAIFRVELSHAATSDDISFHYETANGTALAGKDYNPKSGTATISAGTQFTNIEVEILNDALNEASESFSVNLSNAGFATIAKSEGICTITDDGDPEPEISVQAVYTVNENIASRKIDVVLKLSRPSGYAINSNYTISEGTAIEPEDFQVSSLTGTVSFAAEELEKTVSINLVNDNLYEPQADGYEKFSIQFSDPDHSTAGNLISELRIVDDESKPTLTGTDANATETEKLVFRLELNKACSEDVNFQYRTVDIDANAGSDYVGVGTWTNVSIVAESLFTNIEVQTNGDMASEGTERLRLEIRNPDHANIATNPLVLTGSIFDDSGTPQLSIYDASAVEGSILKFKVELSIIRSGNTKFRISTSNISASAGNDYNAITNQEFTIPRNTRSIEIPVSSIQDFDEEGNEEFKVTLLSVSPSGQVDLFSTEAIGTIIDDDETPEAIDDHFSLNEDPLSAYSENVRTNDNGLGDTPVIFSLENDVAKGNLSFNNDGTFTYIPDSDFHGNDKFQYKVSDADGDESTAWVYLTINSVNDLPQAVRDEFGPMLERTHGSYNNLIGNVLANDAGLGDNAKVILVDDVDNGSLTLSEDGNFTYIPNEQFYGIETFSYKLRDDEMEESVTVEVEIEVSFYNDEAPVANNDSYSGPEDQDVLMKILANDTDLDGKSTIDLSTVQITDAPNHGTLVHNRTTGEVTYKPNVGWSGNDVFKYKVYDLVIAPETTSKESNEATVSIRIDDSNNAPVANCKDIVVFLDDDGKIEVTGDALNEGSTDPDGDDLIFLINGLDKLSFECSDKGIHDVVFTARDINGAQTDCNAKVEVKDELDPVIHNATSNVHEFCAKGAGGKTVYYSIPTFNDNCGGDNVDGSLVSGYARGSSFPLGKSEVSYQYTDPSSNSSPVFSFDVVVTEVDFICSDPDLNICSGEEVEFSVDINEGSGVAAGDFTYSYTYYLNNVEQTVGVIGGVFKTNSLSESDVIKVVLTDGAGNTHEMSLTISVNTLPQTGSIYHLQNI